MQVMLALLDTVILDAPVGPHALLISGEVGVGKTRLLAALYQEATERGFRVLAVSAYEAGRMLLYLPFSEALRYLIRSFASAGNQPEEAAILYEQARASLMHGAPPLSPMPSGRDWCEPP